MPFGISSRQYPRQFSKYDDVGCVMWLSPLQPAFYITHSKQSNKLFNDGRLSRTILGHQPVSQPSKYCMCDFEQHGRERVNGRIDSYRAHKQKI